MFGQTQISGNVTSITSANSFQIIDDQKKVFSIFLNETAVYNDDNLNKSAKDYLIKKIVGKNVIVTISSKKDSKIYGSVLYNCKQLPNIKYEQNDIPCSEGNVLDIEMIQLGFVKYIGQNEYLKSIVPN
jgi:hypothetical protein